MSIGKNAIKRVENNGYSQVKTAAPDMEHSVVAEETAVTETPAVKPAKKKTACKKSVAKKAVKTAEKAYALGDNLPFYLL